MSQVYAKAISELAPGAQFAVTDSDYSSILWLSPGIPQPSESAVNAKVAELNAQAPLKATKDEAKRRIAASDWSVLSDVGISNQADFVAYRAALRNLIINPVTNPVWPTEPEPIWS